MAIKYKHLHVDDFVAKILGGETDFSRTQLTGNRDLSKRPDFSDLKEYLRLKGPGTYLVLDDADLSDLVAPEICLNGASARRTHLERAHLMRARLHYAHLNEAHLNRAHLEGADLRYAHLEGAQLQKAHLNEANLEGAYFDGANLHEANLDEAHLRYARLVGADLVGAFLFDVTGLDKVRDITSAIFDDLKHIQIDDTNKELLRHLLEI